MHLNSALLLYPQIPLLSTHIFKKFCVFSISRFYSRSFVEILHFPSFLQGVRQKTNPLSHRCAMPAPLKGGAFSAMAGFALQPETLPPCQRLLPRGSWQNRKVLTEGVKLSQSEAERASPLPTQKSTASLTESGAFSTFFCPDVENPVQF